eukprot:GHVU01118554.1.p2 GENE.GHVU01118554.1~~GHVU01118554.1.p2  ORF type:complete len:123 (+),score=5.60 GHVU01118554.1:660-1028(+)
MKGCKEGGMARGYNWSCCVTANALPFSFGFQWRPCVCNWTPTGCTPTHEHAYADIHTHTHTHTQIQTDTDGHIDTYIHTCATTAVAAAAVGRAYPIADSRWRRFRSRRRYCRNSARRRWATP